MLDNTQPKVLYTAKVHTDGDRDGGVSQSSDRRLDIKHSVPGTPGTGTNPEQLLAAGWSACFQGAMGIAARRMKVTIPSGTSIDAEIDLVLTGDAYSLAARLNVKVPGLSPEVVRSLVESAHDTCPYSKALKGSIPIALNVI
ncbi:MAG: Ohr family peroxiredoxin [Pseudomonadota bacterium]